MNRGMLDHGKVVWGSNAHISSLNDWSDAEIVHLAMVAHEDMVEAHGNVRWGSEHSKVPLNARQKEPGVTTVLVVDNTAYISTSAKGGQFLYFREGSANRYKQLDPSRPCHGTVQTALLNCQARTAEGWGHRTGASCGEIWATLSFCNKGSERDLDGARVVTVNTKRKTDITQIAHPCGDESDPKVNPS